MNDVKAEVVERDLKLHNVTGIKAEVEVAGHGPKLCPEQGDKAEFIEKRSSSSPVTPGSTTSVQRRTSSKCSAFHGQHSAREAIERSDQIQLNRLQKLNHTSVQINKKRGRKRASIESVEKKI